MSGFTIARESARGTLVLLIGNIVSTGLSTVGTIVIARLVGPAGYGIYTLAFLVPSTLLLFAGLGANNGVTRYVSHFLSRGETQRAVSVTQSITTLFLLFGLALALANLFLAPYIAITVLHREELVPYTQVTSLFIVAQAIAQSSLAALVGWNSMGKVSIFTVLQATAKVSISVGLILAGFGVYGVVAGHAAASIIQGASVTLLLFIAKIRPWSFNSRAFLADTRMMIGFGLPIFTGGLVIGLGAQYVGIILATLVTNTVVGYYQAASNVTVAVTLVAGALASVMFRSFAALHGAEGEISLAFGYAVKYGSYALTPIVFFLFGSASLMIDLFYGTSYSAGTPLLQLLALSFLPVSVGLAVIPSFLNGIGRSRFTMFMSISGALAQVIASLVLGVYLALGAQGVALAVLVSNLTTTAVGLFLSARYLDIRVSMKPLLGTLVACLLALVAMSILPLQGAPTIPALTIDLIVFLGVFLTCAPLLSAIDKDDLLRLSIASDWLGPLRNLIKAIVAYERRMLEFRAKFIG